MEKNPKKDPKKLITKIVIPVLIMIGLFVVWIVKNPDTLSKGKNDVVAQNTKDGTINSDTTENTTENTTGNTTGDANTDFELIVTETIDLEQLKSYGVPIIIDFGADSCIPCKEMAPVLEKLNEELRGKAIVKFVDVWKYQELAQDYPISVIPTQLFFDKDGNPYVPSETNTDGITMYSSKETEQHIFTTHQGGITEEGLLVILSEMGMEE